MKEDNRGIYVAMMGRMEWNAFFGWMGIRGPGDSAWVTYSYCYGWDCGKTTEPKRGDGWVTATQSHEKVHVNPLSPAG